MSEVSKINGGDGPARQSIEDFHTPPKIGSVIVESCLREIAGLSEIENIRDPNLLTKRILIMSSLVLKVKPTFEEKFDYCQRVLGVILADERISQTHFSEEYHASLRLGVAYYHSLPQHQQVMLFGEILILINGGYDISHLDESLNALDRVWSPNEVRLLPVETLSLTKIGHGVDVTHTGDKERLEQEDLREGAKLVNELLTQRKRLNEEASVAIHFTMSKNTSVNDPTRGIKRPVNPGYRNATAYRDLKQYPPLHIPYVDAQQLLLKYGVTPPKPAPGETVREQIDALKEKDEATAGKKAAEMISTPQLLAAQAKLVATTSGSASAQRISALPELHLLMNKYFRWYNEELDQLDGIYANAKTKSVTPELNKMKHPAIFIAAQAFNRKINIHEFENGNTRSGSFAIINHILLLYGYPPFLLSERNHKAFFNIERFGGFDMQMYDAPSSSDLSKWKKSQPADYELAALIANEIGLAT